jgi:hypothetical protein
MQTLDSIGQNACFGESRKMAMPFPLFCGSAQKQGPLLFSMVFPIPFLRRVPRPTEGV